MFALTREDLSTLSFFTKESPYEAQNPPFRQYELQEVVKLALHKHGEEGLLKHFWSGVLPASKRLLPGNVPQLYGHLGEEESGDDMSVRYTQKKYWYNSPSTSTVEGRQSVLQGLRTNVAICSVKSGVWVMTGSHVVFADLMHSFADVANYSYRLLELNRSSRTRDAAHPYGYAPLRYITADRSFVFLFFVGGVCPVIIGLRELTAHIPVCDHLIAPAIVFLASAVLEGAAVKAAYHEILSQAEKEQVESAVSWLPLNFGRVFGYLREGRDVMSTATFTEASSGVLGAGVGLGGLWASWYLQSGVPDVGCSIVMGALVCGVSSFLMRKSGNALLGRTLPSWRVQALVSRLESHPAVCSLYDVKTEIVGTDTVRFKAEVQFNSHAITERLLQAGLRPSTAHGSTTLAAESQPIAAAAATAAACAAFGAGAMPSSEAPSAAATYATLSKRLQRALPELASVTAQSSATTEAQGRVTAMSPWLCRNNDLFYEALVWELKDVERVLRAELGDFKNVHIDLEPW